MIALSASNFIWLLLEDVDDGGGDPYYTQAKTRSSTWLNLETGEVRRLDLCKRVLFSLGWKEMPEFQDKCGK